MFKFKQYTRRTNFSLEWIIKCVHWMCCYIHSSTCKSFIIILYMYSTIAVAGPIVFNVAFGFNTLLRCWEREGGGEWAKIIHKKNSGINLITVNLHYRWPNAYCCASERCHSIQFDYGAPVVFMYVCNGCKIPSPQTKLYQVINVDHFPKTKQKGNISQ